MQAARHDDDDLKAYNWNYLYLIGLLISYNWAESKCSYKSSKYKHKMNEIFKLQA